MSNEKKEYSPGVCNIGTDEIAKRKKERFVSVFATIVVTVLTFYDHDSLFLLILLFAISFFTILMYFQINNRFCVLFGAIGKYNFGKLGDGHKINDPGQLARDRKKVLVIGFQTLVLSLLYTGLIYLLAGSIH